MRLDKALDKYERITKPYSMIKEPNAYVAVDKVSGIPFWYDKHHVRTEVVKISDYFSKYWGEYQPLDLKPGDIYFVKPCDICRGPSGFHSLACPIGGQAAFDKFKKERESICHCVDPFVSRSAFCKIHTCQECGGTLSTHITPCPKKTKPPLGVMPRYIWLEQRIKDLMAATFRYQEAGFVAPSDWSREIDELFAMLGKRK